jgi:hypothetical protein
LGAGTGSTIHSLENRVKKLESELKRAELCLRSADSVKDSAIQRAQEAESKLLQTVQFAQSAQDDATYLKKSLEKSRSDARAFADESMKRSEDIVMRKNIIAIVLSEISDSLLHSFTKLER